MYYKFKIFNQFGQKVLRELSFFFNYLISTLLFFPRCPSGRRRTAPSPGGCPTWRPPPRRGRTWTRSSSTSCGRSGRGRARRRAAPSRRRRRGGGKRSNAPSCEGGKRTGWRRRLWRYHEIKSGKKMRGKKWIRVRERGRKKSGETVNTLTEQNNTKIARAAKRSE